MWACDYCGREYENHYDARYNCPCRKLPWRSRFIRGLFKLASYSIFGFGAGVFLAFLEFGLVGIPFREVWTLGGKIGLVVGFIWGLAASIHVPAPIPRDESLPKEVG